MTDVEMPADDVARSDGLGVMIQPCNGINSLGSRLCIELVSGMLALQLVMFNVMVLTATQELQSRRRFQKSRLECLSAYITLLVTSVA